MAKIAGGRVPRKRKRLFLSRSVPVILSLALQAGFIVFAVTALQKSFFAFYLVTIVVTVAVTLWILSSRDNPAYKLAWMVPILIFPVFGALFYLFWGTDRLARKMRRTLDAMTEHICAALPELQLPAPGDGSFLDQSLDALTDGGLGQADCLADSCVRAPAVLLQVLDDGLGQVVELHRGGMRPIDGQLWHLSIVHGIRC